MNAGFAGHFHHDAGIGDEERRGDLPYRVPARSVGACFGVSLLRTASSARSLTFPRSGRSSPTLMRHRWSVCAVDRPAIGQRVPPQNLVDGTIVDVSALGVKLALPR